MATSKSAAWFVVLIAAAAAIAISILMPVFAPGNLWLAKGGPGPNPFVSKVPSVLLLAGAVGMAVGATGVGLSRSSWRRLSVVSAVCGALAWLLEGPVPGLPWWPVTGYAGIWLGGLLSLVAIGTAIAAFFHTMRKKWLEIPLAVLGLLAGMVGALFATWILLITLGGGMD